MRKLKFQLKDLHIIELEVKHDENIKSLIDELYGSHWFQTYFETYPEIYSYYSLPHEVILLMYKNVHLDEKKCINQYNIGPDDFILVIFHGPPFPHAGRGPIDECSEQNSIRRDRKEGILSLLKCVNADYVVMEFHIAPMDGIIDDLLDFLSEQIDIPISNIKLFKDKNLQNSITNKSDIGQLFEWIKSQKEIDIYYQIETYIGKLVKQRMIGRGAFGCVYKCIEIGSKNEFALKELCVAQHNCDSYEALKSEIDILNQIGDHPRIIRMIKKIESENSLCILMEYASGGSVGQLLRKEGALEENKISKFSFQILEALEYLHLHEILHRDIKGDNILIFQDESVKLCDFGLSKILTDIASANLLNGVHQSTAGTINWMAPEVINGEEYGFSADIWSFGATVVEMLTGKPPYQDLITFQIILKIEKSKKLEFQEPKTLSPKLKVFLNSCLQRNPYERPTASDLLKYEFIQ